MKICKNCNEPIYVANNKDNLGGVNGLVFHEKTCCSICDLDTWTEDYKGPFAELKDETVEV